MQENAGSTFRRSETRQYPRLIHSVECLWSRKNAAEIREKFPAVSCCQRQCLKLHPFAGRVDIGQFDLPSLQRQCFRVQGLPCIVTLTGEVHAINGLQIVGMFNADHRDDAGFTGSTVSIRVELNSSLLVDADSLCGWRKLRRTSERTKTGRRIQSDSSIRKQLEVTAARQDVSLQLKHQACVFAETDV